MSSARHAAVGLVVLWAMAMSSGCNGQPSAPDSSASDVANTEASAADRASPMDSSITDVVRQMMDAPTEVAMMDGSSDVGPYPAGPYGTAQGDILANEQWVGYVNPTGNVVSTTLPFTMTSMQDMRMLGRRYALVHLSEFY